MKNHHCPDPKDPFVRYVAVDLEGNAVDIDPGEPMAFSSLAEESESYSLLRQFMSNELGQAQDHGKVPKHIGYMQRLDLVNYCDVSEKGHFKWLPKGLLIQRLMLDYAEKLAYDWGAFAMKNPLIIRSDQNAVGELMGEFHERDYRVDGGRGICYLRYASDPLAFPFMQKVQFSRKQSPLKVYEEATCFRNEQQGEVSGLKRVRNFMMTDMHAACISNDQARVEFENLCIRFGRLVDRIIAEGRWVLGWEGTIDFYESHRAWLLGIGMKLGVPAFFKLMPEMSHYYAMKNEFQVIAEDSSNIQISTVQWDVKDGKRFDIGYVDERGEKQPCPVILHASSFGSIERALCAILETIAVNESKGIRPMLPFWLSPTQVRIIPVAERHLDGAERLYRQISGHAIRVDVDDRRETVGKRVRDSEADWVPFSAVLGDKEAASNRLSIRDRRDGNVAAQDIDEFVKTIHRISNGMPYRPLSLPHRLSKRPVFLG